NEMPHNCVIEFVGMLKLVQRGLVALDIHEHVVRLVDFLNGKGQLTSTPVFQPVDMAVARSNHLAVAFDHPGDLFALVGMDDENDLVMPHSCLLMGKAPQWFG